MDEEFDILFNEQADLDCDMTAEEYFNFDVETYGYLATKKSAQVKH